MANVSSRVGWVVPLVLASCFGGQTGGEVHEMDPTHGPEIAHGSCQDRVVKTTLDEVSPLGFSAAEILTVAGASHQAKLAWKPSESLTFGPETSESDLDVTISYVGGEVRFIDSEPNEAAGGSDTLVGPNGCPDRLEIDVDVAFRTGGGAFDDHFAATLSANSRDRATLRFALWPAALRGAFHAEPTEPEATLSLRFEATFMEGVAVGNIAAQVEMRRGNAASAAVFQLANWGVGDCATGEASMALDAGTVESVVSTINSHSPMALVWADGRRASLNLQAAPTGTTECVSIADNSGNPPGSRRIPVNVTATSDDGRIAKEFPAWAIAVRREGALSEVRFATTAVGYVPESEFVSTYGIAGVPFGTRNRADARLSSSYSFSGPSAGSANGRLDIWGPDEVACMSGPQTACPGSTGAMLDQALLSYP